MAENVRAPRFLQVLKGGDLNKKDTAFANQVKAKYDLVESVESVKKILDRFRAAAKDMMECLASMESVQSIVSTPVSSPALTNTFSEISLKMGTTSIALEMLRELITEIEKISDEATVAMEALKASVVDVTNAFVGDNALVSVGISWRTETSDGSTLFEPLRDACKKKCVRADFSVEQVEALLNAELSKLGEI